MTPATLERIQSAPALVFDGFSYRYPDGESLALDEISIEVPAGQFVLVCGDSGSSSSSIVRADLRTGCLTRVTGGKRRWPPLLIWSPTSI